MPSENWRTRVEGAPDQKGKKFKSSGSGMKGASRTESYTPQAFSLDMFIRDQVKDESDAIKVYGEGEQQAKQAGRDDLAKKFNEIKKDEIDHRSTLSKELEKKTTMKFLHGDYEYIMEVDKKFLRQLIKIKPSQSKEFYEHLGDWHFPFDEIYSRVKAEDAKGKKT